MDANIYLKDLAGNPLGTATNPLVVYPATGSFDVISPLTTKGDLLGFSTTDTRIAVGTNNYVVIADSSATTGVNWSLVTEGSLSLSDLTTFDVSSSRHGFVPKTPNDATKFLDGTGAWDSVKDSDLSLSDIVTNDVSSSRHGFVPKATNVYSFLNAYGAWGNQLSSLGIGVAPSYLLHIKGTAQTDLPTYSAEFLDADNWTSTDWTGSWAAGWDHTPGNTTVLSHDHNAVIGTYYEIEITISGGTTNGSFTITFGGETSEAFAGSVGTKTFGPKATTTGVLQITPNSTFDRTMIISIKSITAAASPITYITNSAGSLIYEMRSGNLDSNTFLGRAAGSYNTSGTHNVGVGVAALQFNTTGIGNLAFGFGSLNINTVGGYNCGFGRNTLSTNTGGNGNVGIGYNAYLSSTTASYNVGIGYNSGRTFTTGSYNTLVGYYAGYNANQLATAANSMALGANTFTNRSNQVVIGDASVVETHLRTGVYIGSTSTTAHTQPTARLHIAAGAAGAGTAPIKLTSGPVNTSAEDGALEYDGTNLYFTAGATRHTITWT
jgi:hypothetical protein